MSLIHPYPTTTTINRTDCIGNSRITLNDNFQVLQTSICLNIDTLTELESQRQNFDTNITTLSAQVVPGITKAWVNFNATRDTNNALNGDIGAQRRIRSSYNIIEVIKLGDGNYRVYFTNELPNTNYAVIATSSRTANNLGQFTWVQPYNYQQQFVDIKIHSATTTDGVNPTTVSLAIF